MSRVALLAAMLFVWAAEAAAQKTDTVFLKNGDRFTGDFGFLRVDGDGRFDFAGESFNDGKDAGEFVPGGDSGGAGAGGFAANVDDFGALGN